MNISNGQSMNISKGMHRKYYSTLHEINIFCARNKTCEKCKNQNAHKAKNHFEANDLREDGFTDRKNNCDFS